MRVGLTGDSLLEKHGNGRYARGILSRLLSIKSDIEWVILAYQDRPLNTVLTQIKLELDTTPLPSKRITRLVNLFTPLRLPQSLPNLEIVHALRPSEVMNLNSRVKQIVTLLDLGNPVAYAKAKLLNQISLAKMKNQADFIVTISDTVRLEAVEYLRIEPERLASVPLGIDEAFFQPVSAHEIPNLPMHYIVAIGHRSPHKNIMRLINAHTLLQKRHNDFPKLVLTGSPIQVSNINPHIMQTGYVTETELRAIIQGAELLVYPSISEGFGFPPLEAQALGTPAAVSNIPVLRESLLHTVFYFDPFSIESIAFTLEQAIYNSTQREALRTLGRTNAERFRWAEVASKYVDIYRNL